jgi:hypothetical protein
MLLELRLGDPKIDRDAKILGILRHTARRYYSHPQLRPVLDNLPTLYSRYRGLGFPLRNPDNTKIPAWRDLTPWMKVQVGTLALAERGYMQFTVHLHDDLVAELETAGRDLKVYLRDAISRHLKHRFDDPPWFFFVMEDLGIDGAPTRPHAHGSIELRGAPLPTSGPRHRALARLAASEGEAVAQLRAGRLKIHEALRAAAQVQRSSVAATTGLSQVRNVWLRKKPYHPLFNADYVNYAFKNSRRFTNRLGDNRLALPYRLRQEAERLWQLIRDGEQAISQWV